MPGLFNRKLRLVPAIRQNQANKIATKMKMGPPGWVASPIGWLARISPVDARGFSAKLIIHLWNLCCGNPSGFAATR
jgi:hypothetical protein